MVKELHNLFDLWSAQSKIDKLSVLSPENSVSRRNRVKFDANSFVSALVIPLSRSINTSHRIKVCNLELKGSGLSSRSFLLPLSDSSLFSEICPGRNEPAPPSFSGLDSVLTTVNLSLHLLLPSRSKSMPSTSLALSNDSLPKVVSR